ncbi:hypothetical protein NMY22_g17441 [Coprinellus aureogranulatus]|nr:hypothetical protein NMY22_g17441 [Coprinellus aureogranulatus]
MASKVKAIFSEERNPRGIPKAPFIANVDEYMAGSEADIETTLRAFQDAIAKYRYMEANLTQKRASLEEKIPDIRKTLDVVEYLQERREGKSKSSEDDEDDLDDLEEEDSSKPEPITTTYELNDTLYAEAQLEESDSVYLWLGVRTKSTSTLSVTNLDIPPPSLLLARLHPGERDALVQAAAGSLASQYPAGICRTKPQEHDRRPRVPPGATDDHGSKHRAGVQLGREAEKGKETGRVE